MFLALSAIRKFSTEGEGTLAPWDPPRKLVVRGSYGYVRNPMISGVLSILAGEAIFFGSLPVLKWLAFLLSSMRSTFPSSRNRCSWGDSAATTSSTRNSFGVGFRVSHLGTPRLSPQTWPILWRELVVRDNHDKPRFPALGGAEKGVPDVFLPL